MLVYEFAFDHLIMLMVVSVLESTLRAVVCASFVSKVLLIRDGSRLTANRFQLFYYLFYFVVMLTLFLMSTLSNDKIVCGEDIFSYHWFIIDCLDILQSLLITVSALYMSRHLSK